MASYDAFVSYSHAKDKPIAAALQSVIQRLGKPWYRRRALRVFRDDTSLSATPSLWPTIEKALGDSRFLVLLSSPEAAASPWVNKEVSWWLDNKGADTIFVAVTNGELSWDNSVGDFAACENMPLPPVLAGRFASEPKWVDLRAYREGADPRDARFIEAGADFAAAIRGMPKEDLLSQEVRQQRRALTLAWSAAGSLLILAGLAGWQWWEADAAKRSAQRERDRAEKNFGIAKNAADEIIFGLAVGLRDVPGIRLSEMRRILDTARKPIDQLAKAAPGETELQRSRSVMLAEFARTYLSSGDLARAREAAEEGLIIIRALAAANRGNAIMQRGVAVGLNRMGDVRRASGDLEGAKAAYEEGLGIMRTLLLTEPDNTAWLYDVGLFLERTGEMRRATGDRAGALAAYEGSLALQRKLTALDSQNGEWQFGVSIILDRIGDLRFAEGDRAGALAPYEESLAIRRKLAAAEPGRLGWLSGVSASLARIGDVRRALGDGARAQAAYQENLAILGKLVVADPDNRGWLRDFAHGLTLMGDVQLMAGDRAEALEAYRESLALQRKLTAADPGNAEWQAGLALTLYKVATVADRATARSSLGEALAIVDTLARDNRLTAAQKDWPRLLRESLAKLVAGN